MALVDEQALEASVAHGGKLPHPSGCRVWGPKGQARDCPLSTTPLSPQLLLLLQVDESTAEWHQTPSLPFSKSPPPDG